MMRKLIEAKLEKARNDLDNALAAQRQIEYERSLNLWTEEKYKEKMDELFSKEQQLFDYIECYTELFNSKELSESESKAKKYYEFADVFAKKEMEIGRLAGKIYDLERENKVLKDGIKAMFKHIDLVKNGGAFNMPYSLGRYIGSEKDSFLSDSEADKIKAMLKVIENE